MPWSANRNIVAIPPILATVLVMSLSSLAFEVLLARIFAISQWNHLSFMVISIALFGFASSGTYLNLAGLSSRSQLQDWLNARRLVLLISLYSASALIAFITLTHMPLDYFRLPFEAAQAVYLLSAYLLTALPFFCTGLIIALAYASFPAKTGSVYLATMVGSAGGALLPAIALSLFGEGRLFCAISLLPLGLVPLYLPQAPAHQFHAADDDHQPPRYFLGRWFLSTIIGLLIFFSTLIIPEYKFLHIKPSHYKALHQVLQFPDTNITQTEHHLRGRVDTINSPFIRFAPGLSLKFTETLPRTSALYLDGDNASHLYHVKSWPNNRFARATLAYAGYTLHPNPQHVLVVQNAGGAAAACALASGAGDITLVHPRSNIAKQIDQFYPIQIVTEQPRAFLANTSNQFDIIHIEDWGTSLAGTAALNQSHLLTINALTAYWQHLTTQGVIIISRKLLLPPAESLRLWATAYTGLRQQGLPDPEGHIIMLRNWDTFTLLVTRQPSGNLAVIRNFANRYNFDLMYAPHLNPCEVNRFNVFDQPFHYAALTELASAYQTETEQTFFDKYLLDVVPQTDDRPFPDRYLKWMKLKNFHQSMGNRIYTLILSSEVVVMVVLVEALVIAVILLMAPLIYIRKRLQPPAISHIVYFLAVGAGFMFVELYFIKSFTLLFGNPVVSLTVVLGGVLIFSGAGGYWATRAGIRRLSPVLAILILFLFALVFFNETLLSAILTLPAFYRYAWAVVMLFPISFLMGAPFSLGMRYLLSSPGQRAYAWAANGSASVLAAIAAAQMALSIGIQFILAGAIAAYIVAGACVRRLLAAN